MSAGKVLVVRGERLHNPRRVNCLSPGFGFSPQTPETVNLLFAFHSRLVTVFEFEGGRNSPLAPKIVGLPLKAPLPRPCSTRRHVFALGIGGGRNGRPRADCLARCSWSFMHP